MRRTWLIARHHFLQEATKPSFLVLLLSLPLFMALTIGLGVLFSRLDQPETVLGYVDPGGFLVDLELPADELEITLAAFPTAAAARAALEAGEITAYYVLASDFRSSRQAELVYEQKAPPWQARRYFADLVRQNLLVDYPPDLVARALDEPEVLVRARDSGREFADSGPNVVDLLPLLAAAIFGFLALTTSGYMMEVLVAEKENRTMEIVISSVSAGRLMTGKIIGALGIAATQMAVWLVFFAGAAWVGGSLGVPWLQDLHPRWEDIAKIVVVAGPTYLFFTAGMTMIGATMVDSNEAQQVGPLMFLVLFLPIYVLPAIMEHPDGAVALLFSFFPATSMTTIAMRMLVIDVPWWQILTAAAIVFACALGLVFLASKAFRISMLRYGQRLRLGELVRTRRRHVPDGAPAPAGTKG